MYGGQDMQTDTDRCHSPLGSILSVSLFGWPCQGGEVPLDPLSLTHLHALLTFSRATCFAAFNTSSFTVVFSVSVGLTS